MSIPEELFEQKLNKFEAMEGNLSAKTITTRRWEVRLAYSNAHMSYPAKNSEIDIRIKRAAHELRTRSLYFHLMEFEQAGREYNSSVMIERSSAEILCDVEKIRAHVQEMNLRPRQSIVFYEYINHYAAQQLRKSGASPEAINMLLAIKSRTPPKPSVTFPPKNERYNR